jgi:hypothetical protein
VAHVTGLSAGDTAGDRVGLRIARCRWRASGEAHGVVQADHVPEVASSAIVYGSAVVQRTRKVVFAVAALPGTTCRQGLMFRAAS